jgi:hypothetical protein
VTHYFVAACNMVVATMCLWAMGQAGELLPVHGAFVLAAIANAGIAAVLLHEARP